MNSKGSTISIALVLMALSLISVASIQEDAFAQILGMSLTAEASEGSNTILVRGQTASQVTDITFTVLSPDGFNKMAVDQITPDANGNFSTEFKIGPAWKQNGYYTITAMQSVHANSLYTMSVEVEVIDRMTMETLITESNLETGIFVPKLEQLDQKGLNMRANAVVKYLIDRGIQSDRLEYRGYGESRPVSDNESEEGMRQNRRTEIRIIDKR